MYLMFILQHHISKKKLNLYTIRHNHWTFWLKFLQVSTAWSVFELHLLCFAPHKTQCTRRFDISSSHINHRFICTPLYRQYIQITVKIDLLIFALHSMNTMIPLFIFSSWFLEFMFVHSVETDIHMNKVRIPTSNYLVYHRLTCFDDTYICTGLLRSIVCFTFCFSLSHVVSFRVWLDWVSNDTHNSTFVGSEINI